MFKKIVFVLCILLLTVGFTSAFDFKCPQGFNQTDDSHFGNGDYYISIANYTDEYYDYYFKSDSSLEHYVFTFKNNTYQSISTGEIGIFELVEINNQKYIVQVWSFDNPNTCYDYLMEFNKLNNLTPIAQNIQ